MSSIGKKRQRSPSVNSEQVGGVKRQKKSTGDESTDQQGGLDFASSKTSPLVQKFQSGTSSVQSIPKTVALASAPFVKKTDPLVKTPAVPAQKPVAQKPSTYQRIFEKYRYNLIDIGKLTTLAKLSAHKMNLDNITKSGLKQIQVQMFHVVYRMMKDLIQTTRKSRQQLHIMPARSTLFQDEKHLGVEWRGLTAPDPQKQPSQVNVVCTQNNLKAFEAIQEADKIVASKFSEIVKQKKESKKEDIKKKMEIEEEIRKQQKVFRGQKRKLNRKDKAEVDFQLTIQDQLHQEKLQQLNEAMNQSIEIPSSLEIFKQNKAPNLLADHQKQTQQYQLAYIYPSKEIENPSHSSQNFNPQKNFDLNLFMQPRNISMRDFYAYLNQENGFGGSYKNKIINNLL